MIYRFYLFLKQFDMCDHVNPEVLKNISSFLKVHDINYLDHLTPEQASAFTPTGNEKINLTLTLSSDNGDVREVVIKFNPDGTFDEVVSVKDNRRRNEFLSKKKPRKDTPKESSKESSKENPFSNPEFVRSYARGFESFKMDEDFYNALEFSKCGENADIIKRANGKHTSMRSVMDLLLDMAEYGRNLRNAEYDENFMEFWRKVMCKIVESVYSAARTFIVDQKIIFTCHVENTHSIRSQFVNEIEPALTKFASEVAHNLIDDVRHVIQYCPLN